jgi:signal transduction histidine kinase
MAEITSSRGSWPAVASTFAILLLFITLAGIQTLRYSNRIGAEIERIQREQEESGGILNDLRSQTYAVAIELRDYLLASPGDSTIARRRLFEVQQSMNANVNRLETEFATQVGGPVPHFRQRLDRYWQSMEPIFNWTPIQRQEEGAAFLRSNVVPNRAAVLDTTSEIEALRSISLMREREELKRAQRAFRNSLLVALLILISFGLAVASVTSIRLRAVEHRAHNLQLQTERDRQNLRELSHQLVKAQEEERRSISRELHDQIGQMLTAIQMQFNKIEVSQDSPSERNRHLKDGKILVDRTVRSVRDMAMGLRPSILDDLGLIPALEWQTREFTRRSGILVSLKMDGNLSELPDGHRTCLYRVVQEALTNCGRHAQAKQVILTLHGDAEIVTLSVQDDGKGFDPKQLVRRGLGLVGIKERVRELGGNADIHSQPDKGTLLKVEIPFGSELHA